MTDPLRLPNLFLAVQNMPGGAAIIYRHFGKSDCREEARLLRAQTLSLGQQFLIGNDPELAVKTGADGVHFRRDTDPETIRIWRDRCPDWIVSVAGHKSDDIYAQANLPVDALFVSSIFESQSPSAGQPIGLKKLQDICVSSGLPVFALGGINTKTASKLTRSNASGLAGMGFSSA